MYHLINLDHQHLLLTFYHILLDSSRKAKFTFKFSIGFRSRLYARNRFTLASHRCSKNKPSLKIFLVLYDEKGIHSINELKVNLLFQLLYIWIFLFGTGLALNQYNYMRFPVSLWLTYGSFRWISVVWQSKLVHLGEPVWIHIIQILLFRTVRYFAESNEGTF